MQIHVVYEGNNFSLRCIFRHIFCAGYVYMYADSCLKKSETLRAVSNACLNMGFEFFLCSSLPWALNTRLKKSNIFEQGERS